MHACIVHTLHTVVTVVRSGGEPINECKHAPVVISNKKGSKSAMVCEHASLETRLDGEFDGLEEARGGLSRGKVIDGYKTTNGGVAAALVDGSCRGCSV